MLFRQAREILSKHTTSTGLKNNPHKIFNIVKRTTMTLESSKIIGDVVDSVQKTGIKLDIKYKTEQVENGVQISPKHAHSKPTVSVVGAKAGTTYTLLMTDPDPPNPENPIYREWIHWIVSNIPRPEEELKATSNAAALGTEVVPYMGPSPPVGTHRYVFLLFQQPHSPLHIADPSHGENMCRKEFNTRKFAAQYGLGDPVAAAFFMSHK